MRANLSFLTALKAAPAVLAAATALSAVPDVTRASTISSSAFTLTGSFITYTPYPSPNTFEAFVEFPGGTPVTFDGVGGGPFTLELSDLSSAATALGGGVYEQNLVGTGSFSLVTELYDPIANGTLSGGAIYATRGSANATIQLDVSTFNALSSTLSGLPSGGYLIVQGATTDPVSLVTSNPACYAGQPSACIQPYFDAFTLDWTATYQATPYVPTSKTSANSRALDLGDDASGLRGAGFLGLARFARERRVSPVRFAVLPASGVNPRTAAGRMEELRIASTRRLRCERSYRCDGL